MKNYSLAHLILFWLLLFPVLSGALSRESFLINNDWRFRFVHQVQKNSARRISLSHIWNAQDAFSGKQDYLRGAAVYEKSISAPFVWWGKMLFLRFEGVNTISHVLINDAWLCEHQGGFGAFVFEITNAVKYGRENELTVRVSNAPNLDVMPLVGDLKT